MPLASSGSTASVEGSDPQDMRCIALMGSPGMCVLNQGQLSQNRASPELIRRIKAGKPRDDNTHVKDA